ncbi:hypothetical protein BaRGS_00015801, partial [Batillaria attramentaria]
TSLSDGTTLKRLEALLKAKQNAAIETLSLHVAARRAIKRRSYKFITKFSVRGAKREAYTVRDYSTGSPPLYTALLQAGRSGVWRPYKV